MLYTKKIWVYSLIISAAILLVSAFFLLYRYFTLSMPHYVNYTEDSNLNYKVIYKDNNFFNDGMQTSNNKYIASLIDYVKADFKYSISFLEKNINYSYKYKIVANVKVLDNEDKEKIYEENDVIFESNMLTGSGTTNINQSVDIDYNKYNDLINNFKNTYSLKDADSKLNVSMYIELNSYGNNDIEEVNKKAVVSLSMPLTKRTTGIDLSNELTKSADRKILIKSSANYTRLLAIGVVEIVLSLIEICIMVFYCKRTRTIKNIYEREIKKLQNTYSGYIQKINSRYEIGAGQVIKVESFNDMLEIKDTLKTPILMLENEAKDGTFFIIPAANGIIYAYALRVVDIIARKKGMAAPDYDLNNIDKKMPKKYTEEFIDKQIEETRSMKTIDSKNTIRGTKGEDKDLYDQLSKTITMRPIKISSEKNFSTKNRKSRYSKKSNK